jgi:Fe-S cluster biogenesis protein NfuA
MVCTAGVVCCRASSGDPDCCGDDEEGLVEFMPGAPVLAAQEGSDDDEGARTITRTVTETVSAVETGIRADETVDGGDSTVVDGSDSGDLAASGTCTDCTKRETTVGAAVGASLGAALLGALGAVWFLLQRQKRLAATLGQYQAAAGQPLASSVASTGPINRNTAFRPFAELDAERKYELGTESSVSPS